MVGLFVVPTIWGMCQSDEVFIQCIANPITHLLVCVLDLFLNFQCIVLRLYWWNVVIQYYLDIRYTPLPLGWSFLKCLFCHLFAELQEALVKCIPVIASVVADLLHEFVVLELTCFGPAVQEQVLRSLSVSRVGSVIWLPR